MMRNKIKNPLPAIIGTAVALYGLMSPAPEYLFENQINRRIDSHGVSFAKDFTSRNNLAYNGDFSQPIDADKFTLEGNTVLGLKLVELLNEYDYRPLAVEEPTPIEVTVRRQCVPQEFNKKINEFSYQGNIDKNCYGTLRFERKFEKNNKTVRVGFSINQNEHSFSPGFFVGFEKKKVEPPKQPMIYLPKH